MRPTTREEFDIAIICALPHEANPVKALFDEIYDDRGEVLGKLPGDANVYTNGKIDQHFVVLCYMPSMGKGSAAGVASNLRMSYPGIEIALVVGICGDQFIRKRDARTALGRPKPEIRAILASLRTDGLYEKLHAHLLQNIQTLAEQNGIWKYPGRDQDVLRLETSGDTHEEGDSSDVIQQSRLQGADVSPIVHIGTMASADTVMKSGKHRDKIAETDGVIGFEMEGAGIWDNLPCIIIKGVCDYADSHKNKCWQDYAAATGASAAKAFLEYWRPNVRKVIPEVDKSCLRDLLLTYPRDDKLRIELSKGGLLRASFSWILEHPTFHEWKCKENIKLLWIKGDAGKGKTMLMIGLIDEITSTVIDSTIESQPLVSYFLCQASDSRLNNATAILRGLLYMVFTQRPSLLRHMRPKYESAGRRLFEGPDAVYSLLEIFLSLLQMPDLPKIYLIIDAVDECESDLPQLLNLITHPKILNSRIKWIISSRNRDDIEQHMGQNSNLTCLRLELFPDQISQAITNFIDIKVSQFSSLRDYTGIQDSMKSQISQKADGTFLWVALVVTELGKDVFPADMLEVLDETPAGLTPPFGKMMERVEKLHPRNVERCIRILAAASLTYRPLHLLEMAVASGIQKNTTSLEDLQRMVNMCSSFLSVRDNYVYFIHQSAKDYLLSSQSDTVFSVGCGQIHYELYSRSIKAMSMTLCRDICELNDPGPIDIGRRVKSDKLISIEYSCVHWLDHLCHYIDEVRGNHQEAVDEGILHVFFAEHFHHLMEVLGILQKVQIASFVIRKLQTIVQPKHSTLFIILLDDFLRWILAYGSIIEQAPLQVYSGALIFCPEECAMKRLFWAEKFNFVRNVTGVQHEWTNCLYFLEGHETSVIRDARFSPDGLTIATASDDCTVKIWDATTGIVLKSLEGHKEAIISITYLQNSDFLVSASLDGTALLWDLVAATSKEIFKGKGEFVTAMCFSSVSKALIAGLNSGRVLLHDQSSSSWAEIYQSGFDADDEVASLSHGRLWEDYHSKLFLVDKFSPEYEASLCVNNIQSSPSGQLIACSWGNGKVRLLSRAQNTWKQIRASGTECSAMAFSPDGSFLAVGSSDGLIQIWDMELGCWKHGLKIRGNLEYAISAISFSHDSESVIWSAENTLLHWNLNSEPSDQYPQYLGCSITSLAFSPDFSRLVSADYRGKAYVWVTEISARNKFSYMSQDSTSTSSYTVGWDALQLFVQFLVNTWLQILSGIMFLVLYPKWLLDPESNQSTMRLTSTRVCIIAACLCLICWVGLGALYCQSFVDKRRLRSLREDNDRVSQALYRSKGVLGSFDDNEITRSVYDSEGFSRGHRFSIRGISVSPDRKTLATFSKTGHLYDTISRRWKVRMDHPIGNILVKKLVWFPDSQHLASLVFTDHSDFVILSDANTGSCLQVFRSEIPLKSGFRDFEISANGQFMVLVDSDYTLKLWDITKLAQISVLFHPELFIKVISFSPNSHMLLSASEFGQFCLWDLNSGAEVYSSMNSGWAEQPQAEIESAIWSSDSLTWALIGRTGKVYVYTLGRLDSSWEFISKFEHMKGTDAIALSSDYQTIALGTSTGELTCWDIKSGARKGIIKFSGRLKYLNFSKDEKLLHTNQGGVDLMTWKLKSPQTPRAFEDKVCLADSWISCDGKKLIWLPPDYRSEVWDLYESTIAMGQHSGRVVFLELDI